MTREIGSTAWLATHDHEDDWLVCPDCAGTKHLRVLLPDDTMLTIPCAGCAAGYDPPRGYVKAYKRTPRAKLVTITGFEVTNEKTEYHTSEHWHVRADNLFDVEADALAAAEKIAADADERERKQIAEKEKPSRTWAWHVHYHRNCIKRAEKEIEYHSAKLGIARAKSKEAA